MLHQQNLQEPVSVVTTLFLSIFRMPVVQRLYNLSEKNLVKNDMFDRQPVARISS